MFWIRKSSLLIPIWILIVSSKYISHATQLCNICKSDKTWVQYLHPRCGWKQWSRAEADGMPLQTSSRWTSILSSMFFGHSGSAINLASCPHLPLPNALLNLCCLWHSPILSSLQWAAGLTHLSSVLPPRCSRLNYWSQSPPSWIHTLAIALWVEDTLHSLLGFLASGMWMKASALRGLACFSLLSCTSGITLRRTQLC